MFYVTFNTIECRRNINVFSMQIVVAVHWNCVIDPVSSIRSETEHRTLHRFLMTWCWNFHVHISNDSRRNFYSICNKTSKKKLIVFKLYKQIWKITRIWHPKLYCHVHKIIHNQFAFHSNIRRFIIYCYVSISINSQNYPEINLL